MRTYLKLHFLGASIFIFLGAFSLAMGRSSYEAAFKIGFGALIVGFLMKAYDDYVTIQKGKKSEG